jgi:hypothetical protein
MGNAVKYFFVGVNCWPLSICSHIVNSSASVEVQCEKPENTENGVPIIICNQIKVV